MAYNVRGISDVCWRYNIMGGGYAVVPRDPPQAEIEGWRISDSSAMSRSEASDRAELEGTAAHSAKEEESVGRRRERAERAILPNVPEYAKSRPSFLAQTFTSQQSYFTAPNPQFQERDLGGVKRKFLIFFLNSRALFNFFVPRELDRRGVICYHYVLQSCNQQGGNEMAKRLCHKCLREFEPTGELHLCQPCVEKYPNAVDEALEEIHLERKGRLFGNPDSPLYHIHAGLDRDGEPVGW